MKMLELSSPRWGELRHAYGEASDIPELLEQAKTAPPSAGLRSEPWFALWSALCHQYDVYTASYAAVPHLVAIARMKPLAERVEAMALIGSIESCRHRDDMPSIPSDLEAGYFTALGETASLVLECLAADWGESDYRVLLGTLVIARGEYKLGSAIYELEEEVECPGCEATFKARGYELYEI